MAMPDAAGTAERRKAQLREAKARYKERHPERVREQARRHSRSYYQRNRALILDRRREQAYGVDARRFDEMLRAQSGRCAICLVAFTETPHVDHCHTTGRVRDLLCSPCNRGLGIVDDDVHRLRAMADYVEAHRADG